MQVSPPEKLTLPDGIALCNPQPVPRGEGSLLRMLIPLSLRLRASQHSEDCLNIYRSVCAAAETKVTYTPYCL